LSVYVLITTHPNQVVRGQFNQANRNRNRKKKTNKQKTRINNLITLSLSLSCLPMNKYEVIGVVGEGAYGVVLKCRNKENGELGRFIIGNGLMAIF